MLTVAVINYETPELTADCVASVVASPPSEPYEVVVVDNGSGPETVAALRALDGARLVETGVNGGFATAVNRCVAEADAAADVVVVLNSDTQVEAGALDALATAVRHDGVAMAAPLLLERDGTLQRSAHRRFPTLATTWLALNVPFGFVQALAERFVPHPTMLSSAEHAAGPPAAHVMGAAMAFGRAAWEAVGPFDERYFMYLEETDWQERAAASGRTVVLAPEARVRHLHRGGDAAVSVPPLWYLDSARVYFGARGRRDRVVRAVLASSLLVSWTALLLYRPLTRWVPAHRGVVAASLPVARRGFLHAARGTRLPRPDARRA